jgi:hypothetical protein
MLGRVRLDTHPVLVKAALQYSGSAINGVGQVASAVNALLIFTACFGMLGVGIFLHAADTLIRLRREVEAD